MEEAAVRGAGEWGWGGGAFLDATGEWEGRGHRISVTQRMQLTSSCAHSHALVPRRSFEKKNSQGCACSFAFLTALALHTRARSHTEQSHGKHTHQRGCSRNVHRMRVRLTSVAASRWWKCSFH